MLGSVLIPLGFVLCLFPVVSSALALTLGIILTLSVGNPYFERTRKYTKQLLAWSIVGLGAGIDLSVLLRAGTSGVLFTALTLLGALLCAFALGRLFKVPNQIATLIGVGTAICGGSAIAAVSPVIRAKDESISVSLAVVFILNAVALVIFPPIGRAVGLSEDQFGLWAALAIHDTSSVVGASMQYGARALEIGTTVKLTRALWIIPLVLMIAQFYKREGDAGSQPAVRSKTKFPSKYPWFIGGFVLMSALATSLFEYQALWTEVEILARRLLVATLFLIGTGMTKSAIQDAGLRTFSFGVILWLVVTFSSLLVVFYI